MKKYLPFFMIVCVAMVFMSNRFGRTTLTGVPATGAPGESGQTCGSVGCHFQGPFTPTAEISLLDTDGNPVDMYFGGQDYLVSMRLNTPGNPMGYGFQMVSLVDKDSSGINTFKNLPDFAHEALFIERQYIEQNDIIPVIDEIVLEWTAPSPNSGSISFYGIVNAVNGNMSNSGDGVAQVVQTIQEDPLSSTQSPLGLELNLFPNPASEIIVIGNVDVQQTMIYDMKGSEMISSFEKEINISQLNNGLYIARITDSYGKVMTKKFMKQ